MSALYVYYRITADARAETARQSLAVIDAVRGFSGVSGQLMQRADDPLTLMEVYAPCPDRALLEASLRAALDDHWQEAGVSRHEEWFVPAAF